MATQPYTYRAVASFNLPVPLLRRLHAEVPRGRRSQFVSDALMEALGSVAESDSGVGRIGKAERESDNGRLPECGSERRDG